MHSLLLHVLKQFFQVFICSFVDWLLFSYIDSFSNPWVCSFIEFFFVCLDSFVISFMYLLYYAFGHLLTHQVLYIFILFCLFINLTAHLFITSFILSVGNFSIYWFIHPPIPPSSIGPSDPFVHQSIHIFTKKNSFNRWVIHSFTYIFIR